MPSIASFSWLLPSEGADLNLKSLCPSGSPFAPSFCKRKKRVHTDSPSFSVSCDSSCSSSTKTSFVVVSTPKMCHGSNSRAVLAGSNSAGVRSPAAVPGPPKRLSSPKPVACATLAPTRLRMSTRPTRSSCVLRMPCSRCIKLRSRGCLASETALGVGLAAASGSRSGPLLASSSRSPGRPMLPICERRRARSTASPPLPEKPLRTDRGERGGRHADLAPSAARAPARHRGAGESREDDEPELVGGRGLVFGRAVSQRLVAHRLRRLLLLFFILRGLDRRRDGRGAAGRGRVGGSRKGRRHDRRQEQGRRWMDEERRRRRLRSRRRRREHGRDDGRWGRRRHGDHRGCGGGRCGGSGAGRGLAGSANLSFLRGKVLQ